MKHLNSLACTAIAVVAIAVNVSAQNTQQGVATVVRIQGQASYTLESGPNAQWHPLVVGKILSAGATVRTGPNAIVDMVLGKSIQMPQAAPAPNRISYAPDPYVRGLISYKPSAEQNAIRLVSNTTLKIDTLTTSDTGVDTVSDTELDLQKGRIFASVKKLSAASKYFIKIPNGIAGVRGTLFGLGADGWCAVIKDSVLLSVVGSNGQPTTVLVNEGYSFDPNTGQTSPLSHDVMMMLQGIGTSLDTVYQEVVNFSYDLTLVHVSPTSGYFSGSGSRGGGG